MKKKLLILAVIAALCAMTLFGMVACSDTSDVDPQGQAEPSHAVLFDKLSMTEGEEYELGFSVSGAQDAKVTLTSDNPDIVSVDGGKLIALKAGTATVSITAASGSETLSGVQQTVTVTVSAQPHVCVFDREVREDKYKVSDADCDHLAVYYKSCECGEHGEETFTYTEGGYKHSFGAIVAEKAAGTYEYGMAAHYVCDDCGRLFDANLHETTAKALAIAPSSLVADWAFDEACGDSESLVGGYTLNSWYGNTAQRDISYNGTNAVKMLTPFKSHMFSNDFDYNFAGDFTISAMFKTDEDLTEHYIIIAKGPKQAGHFEMYSERYSGYLRFWSFDFGVDLCIETNVRDGKWHMATFVKSGSTIYLYLDGTTSTSADISDKALVPTDEKLTVGYVDGTTADTFCGLIDDIRIYNSAMTADDVRDAIPEDPLAPEIVLYKRADNDTVVITFNKALDPNALEDIIASAGGEPVVARLSADNRSLILEMSLDEEHPVKTIELGNIKGLNGKTASFTVEFSEGLEVYFTFDGSYGAVRSKVNDWVLYKRAESYRQTLEDGKEYYVSNGSVEAGMYFRGFNTDLSGDFTLSVDFQTDTSPIGDYVILAKGQKTDAGHFEIYSQWGSGYLGFYVPALNNLDLRINTNVRDGKMHNVTIVKNGSQMTMYLDGKSGATADVGDLSLPVQDLPLSIGYVDLGANYCGIIGDVRIYSRAISASEIAGICGTEEVE